MVGGGSMSKKYLTFLEIENYSGEYHPHPWHSQKIGEHPAPRIYHISREFAPWALKDTTDARTQAERTKQALQANQSRIYILIIILLWYIKYDIRIYQKKYH